MINEADKPYLERCLELATIALEDGDEPFGSILVATDGNILFEDRNRVADGDHTRHPEFEIARWAANNLSPAQRAEATVYTSGEHCPMCSAAHAWVGLGRIVYISSSEQLSTWLHDMGVEPAPVSPLPIQQIAPNLEVAGPYLELSGKVLELHKRLHGKN